ncbi:unnamed protein product [Sphagnum balticum]
MNVSITEEDLLRLLADNAHMRKQVTELQNRGTELLIENRELKEEVLKFQDGIRKHRDASGHNLCWYVPELWDILPDKLDPKPEIPSTQEFLRCCKVYRASLDEPKE